MRKLEGKWLVAISAGSDSMALLSMCKELDMDIMAAHVNYHYRKEADEEQKYVEELCQKINIPLLVKDIPFTYEGNFEAAARSWRYDFFSECVEQYHLKGVLVAHHEDDLLETYFMQEEKGSIPSYYGLKEDVLYRNMFVHRPLLHTTKEELIAYCEQRNIRYYVDQTNMDESYTRNRIRHQVVEKMNRFERDMVLKEIEKKNAIAQERKCRVNTYIRDGKILISLYHSLREEDRLQLLRSLLEEDAPRISLSYLKEIDSIILNKNDFMISCKQKNLVSDGDVMFLHSKSHSYCDWYSSASELNHQVKAYYGIQEGTCGIFAITLTEDDFPICIRNVKDGDEIEMRFGKKKVHRFFIDRHIPLYRRETWPVIENRHRKVIFVSGLGCDKHHYTVNPTCNVVEYTLLKEN